MTLWDIDILTAGDNTPMRLKPMVLELTVRTGMIKIPGTGRVVCRFCAEQPGPIPFAIRDRVHFQAKIEYSGWEGIDIGSMCEFIVSRHVPPQSPFSSAAGSVEAATPVAVSPSAGL